MGDTGMAQRLHHGEVGIVELDVFAYQGHLDGRAGVAEFVHQLLPGRHVAVVIGQIQHIEHFAAKPFLLQGQGHCINAVGIEGRDDGPGRHPTEPSDLPLHLLADGAVTAADQHIRLDADGAQFLHRMLGGLGLEFARGADEGQQCDVDIRQIVPSNVSTEFADGFQEGQRFDVTDGAADFCDHHIGVAVGGNAVDAFADLTGDVGNHLHRAAVVVTPPFLVDHRLVDRAGGHAVQARHGCVREALVVAQIQIGFGTVLGDEHLPVLNRAHRAGIHVEVRIQLQDRDVVPP